MFFLPFQILGAWFRGLLAIALLCLGAYLLKQWYDHATTPIVTTDAVAADARRDPAAEPEPGAGVVRERPAPGLLHVGFDRPTAYLLGGLLLAFVSLGGGSWTYPLLRRSEGKAPPSASTEPAARNAQVHRIRRPDGSERHAVTLGPVDGPVIVLTHGWSVDSTEWNYSEGALAKKHRVILWDLPGLGKSDRPRDNDFSLENLARDLDAVLDLAGGRPAVVVGHSIGGMTALTYAKMFPEKLGPKVAGFVLVHTTYTNPTKTNKWAAFLLPLQKPLLEPLCYVQIALAPLFWAMNWMSYLNGSMHRSSEKSSFSGKETREQLNQSALYGAKASPSVVARGMLAMFKYDATATLATIPVPVLDVTGDIDPLTLPEANAHIAGTVPDGRLDTLRPAKHMGHMEHHDRFAATVENFVAGCLGSGRDGLKAAASR